MSIFGIPYQGSKYRLLKQIFPYFLKSKNFYDLFGGGFSVTHFILKKYPSYYENYYFNEPREGIIDLIQDSIKGKYSYENFKPKFIDRETFFKEKEKSAYIRMSWSFGNNGCTYLFGKKIEIYKKALHNAAVFNEYDEIYLKEFNNEKMPKDLKDIKERRLWIRRKVKELKGHPFKRLEQLEQLERLQRLEKLNFNLNFSKSCYSKIKIKKNSFIYCDIPYDNGDKRNYDRLKFNYSQFFNWAANQKNPVLISEYEIKDKRLKEIASFEHKSIINHIGPTKSTEKLFANEAYLKLII